MLPKAEILKNNKSARDNSSFVTEEIAKLLDTGVLIEVKTVPTVINALTVAINHSGKKRLVLDLRSINPILHVPKYKFEDIRIASTYFTKDCFM